MIVRVQSTAFLLSPPVLEFLGRAYHDKKYITLRADLAGLLPVLDQPTTGVFIGEEDGQFCGIAVVFLPTSPLYAIPQVRYFYNDGSIAARDNLVKAVFEYVTSAGYNKVWTINLTGKPDKVYSRAFRQAGPVYPIGSILEFDLSRKEEQENAKPVRRQQRQRAEPKLQRAGKRHAAGLRGDAKPAGKLAHGHVQRRASVQRRRKRVRAA